MTVKDLFKKIEDGENVTICCVGDSITYGETHCRPEETYTAKLASEFSIKYPKYTICRYDGIFNGEEKQPLAGYDGPILVHSGSEGSIEIIRSGVGGDTVARLIKRINDFTTLLPNGIKPDLITIMTGINDALQQDPDKYVLPEKFAENYRNLLNLIKNRLPDTAIVLLTPSYNCHGVQKENCLEAYCDEVKKLSTDFKIPLIDVHELWMQHLISGSEHFGQRDWLSDISYDACHPTPIGAEMTAKLVFERLNDLKNI